MVKWTLTMEISRMGGILSYLTLMRRRDMPKFEITFRDEIEAETEEQAIEWLFEYLNDCVRNDDVSAFGIYRLKENQNG